MSVNLKKNIRLLTNSKYFNPSSSRLYNTFQSPRSYRSRKSKIEGYETRLYWHFKYCQDIGGQTFYYTLTYNDKNIPKFYGVSCFDYEDIRYLLTGGFYQYLRRNYGTKLKYFVGAELGDGKGSRGMHNNPHYHILFFLEPDKNSLCPYKKINPVDFRHLVRLYWQGFDQDTDGYKDYRDAKFGIAKEGDKYGLVTDFRACCYCAKYVTKDVKLVRNESSLTLYLRFYYDKVYKFSAESFKDFYAENRDVFETHLQLQFYKNIPLAFEQLIDSLSLESIKGEFNGDYYKLICKLGMFDEYSKFVDKYIEDKIHEVITLYRNRYSNKCRISQGVGLYALTDIKDFLEPTVSIPSKNGFKSRSLPLYLYRKLYTDVVKTDSCTKTPRGTLKPVKHSPVRVLNDLGIEMKLHQLPKVVGKIAEQAKNNLSIVLANKELYESMVCSDVNTAVTLSHKSLIDNYNRLQQTLPLHKIFERYAIYKLVYEDRFFAFSNCGSNPCDSFPFINVESDYKRFLTSNVLYVTRSELRVSAFVESNMEGYLPYFTHPYFLPYFSIFSVLDLCADYFFVQKDNQEQSEAESIAEIKRFHNKRMLTSFYSQFKTNVL